MYIVIIGATMIGRKIARQLSINNDIGVIDNNPKNINKLQNLFDGRIIEGVEFDKSVLKSAEVENANQIIICTDSDNINIMTAQMLNKIFEVKDIILCLSSISMAKLYKDSEFKIICTTSIIANEIIETMNDKENG